MSGILRVGGRGRIARPSFWIVAMQALCRPCLRRRVGPDGACGGFELLLRWPAVPVPLCDGESRLGRLRRRGRRIAPKPSRCAVAPFARARAGGRARGYASPAQRGAAPDVAACVRRSSVHSRKRLQARLKGRFAIIRRRRADFSSRSHCSVLSGAERLASCRASSDCADSSGESSGASAGKCAAAAAAFLLPLWAAARSGCIAGPIWTTSNLQSKESPLSYSNSMMYPTIRPSADKFGSCSSTKTEENSLLLE